MVILEPQVHSQSSTTEPLLLLPMISMGAELQMPGLFAIISGLLMLPNVFS